MSKDIRSILVNFSADDYDTIRFMQMQETKRTGVVPSLSTCVISLIKGKLKKLMELRVNHAVPAPPEAIMEYSGDQEDGVMPVEEAIIPAPLSEEQIDAAMDNLLSIPQR